MCSYADLWAGFTQGETSWNECYQVTTKFALSPPSLLAPWQLTPAPPTPSPAISTFCTLVTPELYWDLQRSVVVYALDTLVETLLLSSTLTGA